MTTVATTVLRALAAAGVTDPALTTKALAAAGLLTPSPKPQPKVIDITVLSLIDGTQQTVTLADYYAQDIDGEHKIAGNVKESQAVIGPVVIKAALPDGTRILRSGEAQLTHLGSGLPYLAIRSHSAPPAVREVYTLSYQTSLGAVTETRATHRRAALDARKLTTKGHAWGASITHPYYT
ncbi:hypothetical protein [Streptomyces xiamenensis]|uniref:hypothetical protein n=1 Tax=Streptomyces xiamenensis TaxID=408015 RepID=UPI003D73D53B